MAISEADIKRLWGKAAGRCSRPGCGIDCLPYLDEQDPTVIGEMAHVIAKSSIGPRGDGTGGDNTYANLILLCPTHHTLIDKAPPGKFPLETLLGWKAEHEQRVAQSLEAPLFPNRGALNKYIRTLLVQNRTCLTTYGPGSDMAKRDPQSSGAAIWPFRKMSLIVPNNRRIISAVTASGDVFSTAEFEIVCRFVEHAEGFEKRCFQFIEGIPRFPNGFAELFDE